MAMKWLSGYNTTGCSIVEFELLQSSQDPNLDLIRHHQKPQGLTHWNNTLQAQVHIRVCTQWP